MATLVLDDRNPDISYTGGLWISGGISLEYNSTTTWINGTGGIVSLQFNGISISVWGTIGSTAAGANPHTSYTVDGGAPVMFSANQDPDNWQYQQMFFLSGPLDPTSHTLTIETLTPGAAYYLDFIQISVPSADQFPTTIVTTISTILTSGSDIPTFTTTRENIISTDSTRSISTQRASDSTPSHSITNSLVPLTMETTTVPTTPSGNGTPTSSIFTVTENIISTPSISTEIENDSTASRPLPMAAIVGGSLGGLVVIVCIFIILRLRALPRRKVELEPQTQPRPQRSKVSGTVLHEDVHTTPRAPNLVTPFPLEVPESPAPSYASLSPP